jgi:hypothetical protein
MVNKCCAPGFRSGYSGEKEKDIDKEAKEGGTGTVPEEAISYHKFPKDFPSTDVDARDPPKILGANRIFIPLQQTLPFF